MDQIYAKTMLRHNTPYFKNCLSLLLTYLNFGWDRVFAIRWLISFKGVCSIGVGIVY